MTSPSGAQRLESDPPARTDPPADPALEALLAITQELSGTLEIEQAFARALDIVKRALGAARASIALVDEPPGEVSVGGLVGDGVDENALVRVPILTGERSVGELSVLLRQEEQRNLPAITKVLQIVSAVVAQRLRVHRLVQDECVVHAHHLPPSLQTADASGTAIDVSLSEAVGTYERSLIEDALRSTHGNRAKAARLLRTTERILAYKAKAYGIDASRYRRRRNDPTIP